MDTLKTSETTMHSASYDASGLAASRKMVEAIHNQPVPEIIPKIEMAQKCVRDVEEGRRCAVNNSLSHLHPLHSHKKLPCGKVPAPINKTMQ